MGGLDVFGQEDGVGAGGGQFFFFFQLPEGQAGCALQVKDNYLFVVVAVGRPKAEFLLVPGAGFFDVSNAQDDCVEAQEGAAGFAFVRPASRSTSC